MPVSEDDKFTYSVCTKAAYLLPPSTRRYFKAPPMEHFGNSTYIYATGPKDDAEPWRQEFARFAKRVQDQQIEAVGL